MSRDPRAEPDLIEVPTVLPGIEGACRPPGSAPCGRCPSCREKEARLFDAVLRSHLEAIEAAAAKDETAH